MFTTLGCFHSLQPTQSPFDTPKIPCLTPTGFARWLTIQMLLCPEENIGFLQKAVHLWNVPGPNGTIFPKYIPRDAFPTRPDEEMENWHRMVTGRLNQKNYMRRIQNSPHQSPHPEAHDRRDGYFSGSQVGKPSRPSRSSSRDDKTALYRRRSSVPDFASPAGERGSHWEPKNPDGPRKARSHSAQRPPLRQAVNDPTLLAVITQANRPGHLQTVPPTGDMVETQAIKKADRLRRITLTIDHQHALLQPLTKVRAAKQAPRTHSPVPVLVDLGKIAVAAALVFGYPQSLGRTNAVILLMRATVHLPNIHNLYGPNTTRHVRATHNLNNIHILTVELVPLNGGTPIGMAINQIRTPPHPCRDKHM